VIWVDWLAEPLQYEFFRHGLGVATLAGALCGLIGVYVTLRGMSYIGHGLSHAVFGGAAASALVSLNFYVGAGLWGVASALAIGRVTHRRIIGSDAAIGVITSASFALGIALLGLYGQVRKSIDAAIFGSVLGVSATHVWAVAAVTVFAAAVVIGFYRKLLFASFDPEVAEVSGVDTARMDALLMVLLSVSILVTMNVLGVVLIAAVIVTPAVVARMLTNTFARMLWLSTFIGALCGFVGMILSYHLDISSGATIVLVGAAFFTLVFAFTGLRGRGRAPFPTDGGHGVLPADDDTTGRAGTGAVPLLRPGRAGRAFAVALSLALLSSACGGDSSGAAPPATTTARLDTRSNISACTTAGTTLSVTARNSRFGSECLAAPGYQPLTISYDNRDSVGHNIVLTALDVGDQVVFRSQVFVGPKTEAFAVGPLKPGTYAFRCDAHPSMSGRLIVR
jgi:ABC-type Mn2+/Zn2+ transport system permease subunit/plastocyanin